MNQFLTDNYDQIMLMAKKICRSHQEWEDVAHFAIEQFIVHESAEELIKANRAMQFISGIMHRSFHSSTSRYHTLYRQKGRVHTTDTPIEGEAVEYDYELDATIDRIEGLMADMQAHSVEMWFRVVLFEMWIETPNFSELSRKTGIPRTSISQAVQEAKDWIKKNLDDIN